MTFDRVVPSKNEDVVDFAGTLTGDVARRYGVDHRFNGPENRGKQPSPRFAQDDLLEAELSDHGTVAFGSL
jgi:hypothetical protein